MIADPRNFPRWNSAVRSVIVTAVTEDGAGATYTMQFDLPTGSAANVLEVVQRHRPTEFVIKTTTGPTPFAYDIEFTPANGGTVVKLNARAELGRIGDLIGPIARGAVKPGVNENFAGLKRVLERPPKRLTAVRCSVSPQGPLRSPDVSRRGSHPSG
jgi:Polyketide cyclase / dehydrase and lipid transport